MIIIREATHRDASDISQVVCQCYDAFGQTDGYTVNVIAEIKEARGSEKCIRELISHEDMFVAEEEDRIKGMISVKSKEITKLYINPNCQRSGIGRMLFNHAESFIKDHGHCDMFLGASVQTPVPFYERMGMHVSNTRRINCGPCIGMTSIILEKKIGAEPEQSSLSDTRSEPRRTI